MRDAQLAAAPQAPDLRRATREALDRGHALYRAGQWYEAHEVWEEAWREERGRTRDLLQGLILVAGALVKAHAHGNPRGAVKLLEAAQERLAPFPDQLLGLDLSVLRADAGEAQAAARRWRDGEGTAAAVAPPRLWRVRQG